MGGAGIFGLIWQWGSLQYPVNGRIYSQPRAVSNVSTQYSSCDPCDLVFVATEEDWLYAFKAESSSSQPVCWHLGSRTYSPTPVRRSVAAC